MKPPAFSPALRRRGVTLTELLVAMLVSLAFMGSVVTAYIQVARAAEESQAQVRAHVRARSALDQISRDLKRVGFDAIPFRRQFFIESTPLPYGDNVDHDGDGAADEEIRDGFDTDGDWTLADDRHAEIGPHFERADYVGFPDLGDLAVDEDCRFSRDFIRFYVSPDPSDPAGFFGQGVMIEYFIGTFDGEDNVLIRRSIRNPFGTPVEALEPIAFDVVSLDFLAWNANTDAVSPRPGPPRPYWQQTWDSFFYRNDASSLGIRPIGTNNAAPPPPFEFPASVYVSITVSAERVPLSEIGNWPVGTRQLRTQRLETVVNIEPIIKSVIYQNFVRPRL